MPIHTHTLEDVLEVCVETVYEMYPLRFHQLLPLRVTFSYFPRQPRVIPIIQIKIRRVPPVLVVLLLVPTLGLPTLGLFLFCRVMWEACGCLLWSAVHTRN